MLFFAIPFIVWLLTSLACYTCFISLSLDTLAGQHLAENTGYIPAFVFLTFIAVTPLVVFGFGMRRLPPASLTDSLSGSVNGSGSGAGTGAGGGVTNPVVSSAALV